MGGRPTVLCPLKESSFEPRPKTIPHCTDQDLTMWSQGTRAELQEGTTHPQPPDAGMCHVGHRAAPSRPRLELCQPQPGNRASPDTLSTLCLLRGGCCAMGPLPR